MTDTNANPGDGDQDSDDNSEKMIPESQLRAALKNQGDTHKAAMQELRTGFEDRISRLEKPSAPEKNEEIFTRPELNKLVEDGHITKEQADLKWDAQQEAKFTKKAETVSRGVVEQSQLSAKVTQDVDRYIALEPDLAIDGTELREKVKKEYNFLVKMGDPAKSMATELKALRSVLGPLDSFELARSGRTSHETHEETGGGGGGGAGGGGKNFEDSLTPRKRKYYQGMIDDGYYKDWDAVKKLLNPSRKAA